MKYEHSNNCKYTTSKNYTNLLKNCLTCSIRNCTIRKDGK